MASSQTSSASTFTVRELTGQKRKLELKGRALPYRGVKFRGTMAVEFTWYPGNPEATSQPLGAREDPTSFHGMWKNRFLGATISSSDPSIDGKASDDQSAIILLDGVQLTDTGDAVDAVDDMRRKGQLMEMTWDSRTYVGHMTAFAHEWQRHEDVSWEMEFGWISQGDPTVAAVTSSQADILDVYTQWSKVVNQLDTAQKDSPFAQLGAFNSALNSAITSIVNGAFTVQDAVGSAVSAATSPLSTVKRLAGIMATIQDSAQAMIDQLTSAPAVTFFSWGIPIGQVPFGQVLQAEKYNRGLYEAARAARTLAAQQLWQFQSQITPAVIATFVAKQDTDLRDVSTEFYGTPSNWKSLMNFNDMDSSAVAQGQVVFVPPASSSSQAA